MDWNVIEDALTIFKREMIIFRANWKSNIIRSIIFPVVILLFFGNIGNGTFSSPIAVTNLANNPQSISFINALGNQKSLVVKELVSESTGLAMLQNGTVSALVVILPNFPSSANTDSIYVYYSNSNLNTIGAGVSYITSVASEFDAKVGGSSTLGLNEPAPPSSQVKLVSTSAVSISYLDFLVGGVIAMVAPLGTIFGGGVSLITDRQLGNLKMFLVTPISGTAVILGKTIYGTVAALIYVVVALGIATIMGAKIAMGIAGLAWILAIVVVISMGLSGVALILADKIKKFEVYTIIANAIVLPLWFLSGAFFPASADPAWMQIISSIDPLTYAVSGIRYVMLDGYFPINAILTDFGVLILFTVVAVFLAVKLFKKTI